MGNILSLDQSLNTTGWAIFSENGKLFESGIFTTTKSYKESKKLFELFTFVSDMCGKNEIETIVFEDIQNQCNDNTYKKLAHVQGCLMTYCEIADIDYIIYPSSHWRSVIGGTWGKKRDEQKQQAVYLVSDIFNKDVSSDEADAICIGYAYFLENK